MLLPPPLCTCLGTADASPGTAGWGDVYEANTCILLSSAPDALLYDLARSCDLHNPGVLAHMVPRTGSNTFVSERPPAVLCNDTVVSWSEWLALGMDAGSQWVRLRDLGGAPAVQDSARWVLYGSGAA